MPAALPLTSAGILLSGIAAVVSIVVTAQLIRRLRSEADSLDSGVARPFLIIAILFAGAALLLPVFEQYIIKDDAIVTLALLLFLGIQVPWCLFALRYAGRGQLITRPRLVMLFLFVGATVSFEFTLWAGILNHDQGLGGALSTLVSFVVLLLLGVSLVAAGLAILSTYQNERVNITTGIVATVPLLIVVVIVQFVGQVGTPWTTVVGGGGLLIGACGLALIVRHDVLAVRPGTSILGERKIVENMSEVIMVVDAADRVVRSNNQARQLFPDDIKGQTVEELLNVSLDSLKNKETIGRWTAHGYREFDPRVSAVTDEQGRHVGSTITLLDVTDREIREQRNQVLNRVLRHNLRNGLSAIEARADLAVETNRSTENHVAVITDITDDLNGLGSNARRIEKLIRNSAEPSRVDLGELIEGVVKEVTAPNHDITVRTTGIFKTIHADRRLLRYAIRNIVQNAVEHNTAGPPIIDINVAETGGRLQIAIADNGPGIPDGERKVIETGDEHPQAHGSGLGLWGTKWAVRTLGGTLSLGKSDIGGTEVVLTLPRPCTPMSV